jgi:hypothetical protein
MQVGSPGMAAVLAAVICACAQPAEAQRAWHVSGYGSSVVATDCRNCTEDVGIRFHCRGLGRAADVSVPAVAAARRPSERRPRIEFFVDGLGVAYDVDLERQGLVGYVPQLSVGQGDPLVERLAAGTSLRVVFAGRSADITLQGARAALAAFASHCAWSNAKALAEPLVPGPARPQDGPPPQPPPPSTGPVTGPPASAERSAMRWQYYAGRGADPSRLIFGVPGSSEAILRASCLAGATRALIELLAGPAGLDPGRPVEIGVHSSSRGIRGVRGVVNEAGRATFSSGASDILWSTLQSGGAVTFSVQGRPAGFVESQSADQAISNFLAVCR